MSITQINVWCCEVCRYQAVSVAHNVRAHSNPVVTPPNDIPWGVIVRDQVWLMACPHCLAKEKAHDEAIRAECATVLTEIKAYPQSVQMSAFDRVNAWNDIGLYDPLTPECRLKVLREVLAILSQGDGHE